MRKLIKETLFKRPISEVFGFFSNAENLNLLTPQNFHFRILTPQPLKIQKGSIIDYKISLKGIPVKWRTEITEWEPPYRFVDVQLKGPYKVWVHEHTFAEKDGGTLVTDKVSYLSKGWILEPVLQKLFINKNLEEIFDYREKKLKLIFKDDK